MISEIVLFRLPDGMEPCRCYDQVPRSRAYVAG
jgi:hypothetical protein